MQRFARLKPGESMMLGNMFLHNVNGNMEMSVLGDYMFPNICCQKEKDGDFVLSGVPENCLMVFDEVVLED